MPVCRRPFAEIAKKLNSGEREVLKQAKVLRNNRTIRCLRAIVNYNALGFTSTLAAAHIEQEILKEVADTVNSLKGVSHNYLRGHFYNLWFTLRAKSEREIENILRDLSGRFGAEFYSLPVERSFKLDVCFDARSGGKSLLKSKERKIAAKKTRLNQIERKILEGLECRIEITEEPFDFLCSGKLNIDDVLRIIRRLIDKGAIRRIAATVDYKRLGFGANLLFACKVGPRRIIRVGKALAKLPIVSHCYQRKPSAGFEYNLFAMMHSKSKGVLQSEIKKFLKKFSVEDFIFLETVKQLKSG